MCGPPRYAEIRINLSQAFNGIGTVVAPTMGSYVFFKNLDDSEALANVQWVYLSIAVFVLLLAVLFFFSNIPEITDAGALYPPYYFPSACTPTSSYPPHYGLSCSQQYHFLNRL